MSQATSPCQVRSANSWGVPHHQCHMAWEVPLQLMECHIINATWHGRCHFIKHLGRPRQAENSNSNDMWMPIKPLLDPSQQHPHLTPHIKPYHQGSSLAFMVGQSFMKRRFKIQNRCPLIHEDNILSSLPQIKSCNPYFKFEFKCQMRT